MLESLSPIDVALIKKIGGNGSSYTLPIATETTLGGVKPVAKTDAMTQSVGVDASGALWAAAGSGGSGKQLVLLNHITMEEDAHFTITKDLEGNPINEQHIIVFAKMAATSENRDSNFNILNSTGNLTGLAAYGFKSSTSVFYHFHDIISVADAGIVNDLHRSSLTIGSNVSVNVYNRIVEFSGSICGIASSYPNTGVPAGSEIYVYAVR